MLRNRSGIFTPNNKDTGGNTDADILQEEQHLKSNSYYLNTKYQIFLIFASYEQTD